MKLELNQTASSGSASTHGSVSFEQEYLGAFAEPTDTEKQLKRYAVEYQERAEAYDRTVCTGGMNRGAVMPADSYQLGLINKNATKLREELWEKVRLLDFSYPEWWKAIRDAVPRGRNFGQNALGQPPATGGEADTHHQPLK